MLSYEQRKLRDIPIGQRTSINSFQNIFFGNGIPVKKSLSQIFGQQSFHRIGQQVFSQIATASLITENKSQ